MNLGVTCLLFVGLLVIFQYPCTRTLYAATPDPVFAPHGVVAADNVIASRVGAAVLSRGGNAVDAAVATALALGVVSPSSSGIGGGGFAVVYIAAEKKTYAIDFREIGPAAISPKSFVRGGKVRPELSLRGGLAVGVPGEPAGLEYLVKRFGKRSWRRAVLPAQRLAARGFPVSRFVAYAAKRSERTVKPRSALGQLIFKNGHPIQRGQRIRRPALARTLWQLAQKGARAFYGGAVAKDIVNSVRAAGGSMTLQDLAGYRVASRTPLRGKWRGYDVATMPIPSSGGVALLEALGILDATGQDLRKLGADSSASLHVIAESLKHAFADRARFLGDANPAKLASGRLLNAKRLQRLGKTIRMDKVLAHDAYGDKTLGSNTHPPAPDHGTSHLCVVDQQGNAVALTTTVNSYFGAKLLTSNTGIVLNNQINDFSLKAGLPNQFGLVQSDFNLVGAGKRPLSSMSPTLVFKDGKVVGCFGGSGGPRIISNTMQVMINSFVYGMDPMKAVSMPRIHHQWEPDKLYIEAETPADVLTNLRRRGHTLDVFNWRRTPTAVQAIVRGKDGVLRAASDPRKGGWPAAAR